MLDLSDSSNDLVIIGQSGDVVNLGAGFNKSMTGVSAPGEAGTFDLYVVANTDARVFIEQGITVP